MRTNVAGFTLTLGMGLVVVLLGLLALSAAGLTSFAPELAEAGATMPADTVQATGMGSCTPQRIYGPELIPVSSLALPAEDKDAITTGETLFKNNCYQCHTIREQVVGPALAGITQRRPVSWLVNWVHNPAKVIASGDEYAVKLFNDNGKQQMPAFPQLSDKDIQAIVAYIVTQEGAGSTGPAAPVYVEAVAAR